jgi:lipid-A-disaccharide synthase-like uncharacterized protein
MPTIWKRFTAKNPSKNKILSLCNDLAERFVFYFYQSKKQIKQSVFPKNFDYFSKKGVELLALFFEKR